MNVGHKRNVLVDRCAGGVVAMFDDDNIYAPQRVGPRPPRPPAPTKGEPAIDA